MRKINIIVVFLFILSIVSCKKELQIDYPALEKKIIVNSLFTLDSLFKVRLTTLSEINSTEEHLLTDAVCEIWENDIFKDKLEYTDNGFYVSDWLKPEGGKKYTVKVHCSGYEDVIATSYVPEKTSFTILDTNNFAEIHQIDEEYYFGAEIQIDDPKAQKNYYDIIVKGLRYPTPDKDSAFDYFYVYDYKTDNSAILKEGLLDYYEKALVFADDNFDGQTYNVDFLFKMRFPIYNDYQSISRYDAVIFLFWGSKEYYEYKKSFIKHINNQYSDIYDGAGDPVVIYSNVENGYGIFAGYQTSIDTIDYHLE